MAIDLKPNIVAWYKMNDVSGLSVLDSSGNGYNGTAQRDCSLLTTTGKIGGALRCEENDYIDTGQTFQSTFQSDFSISMWLKPADGQPSDLGRDIFGSWSDDFESLINIWHRADGSISMGYQSVFAGGGISTSTPAATFKNGQETWHYLTFIIKQITPTSVNSWIYFDGILLATGGELPTTMSNYTNSENCFIGQASLFGLPQEGYYFNGSIDDFCIFNKALSQEEITFLYNGGFGAEELGGGMIINEQWSF